MKKYLLLLALLPSLVLAQSSDSTNWNDYPQLQMIPRTNSQPMRFPDKVQYIYEQDPCGAGYTGTRNFLAKYVNDILQSRSEISNSCLLIPPPPPTPTCGPAPFPGFGAGRWFPNVDAVFAAGMPRDALFVRPGDGSICVYLR